MLGNNPYFVDLESLFQGYDSQDLHKETAYKKVLYSIKDSVIRTCLFPAKLDKQSKLDISGLTGTGSRLSDRRSVVDSNSMRRTSSEECYPTK